MLQHPSLRINELVRNERTALTLAIRYLHAAVREGDWAHWNSIIHELLANPGIDVNTRHGNLRAMFGDQYMGYTALLYAAQSCRFQHRDVIRALMHHGTMRINDPVDNQGNTALSFAISQLNDKHGEEPPSQDWTDHYTFLVHELLAHKDVDVGVVHPGGASAARTLRDAQHIPAELKSSLHTALRDAQSYKGECHVCEHREVALLEYFPCGHQKYCRNCTDVWRRAHGDFKCPYCMQPVEDAHTTSRRVFRGGGQDQAAPAAAQTLSLARCGHRGCKYTKPAHC